MGVHGSPHAWGILRDREAFRVLGERALHVRNPGSGFGDSEGVERFHRRILPTMYEWVLPARRGASDTSRGGSTKGAGVAAICPASGAGR